MKDIAYKTFEVAAALRYRSRQKKLHILSEKSQVDTREGIEKVDAAYDTLVAGGHNLSQTLKRLMFVFWLAGSIAAKNASLTISGLMDTSLS